MGRNQNRPVGRFRWREFQWELQDLMDIPRAVKHSSGGFRYEKPDKAAEVIRVIFGVIKDALLRGEKVNIPGFGTFKIIDTKPTRSKHTIVGNSKGKVVGFSQTHRTVPSKKKVIFIPSVHLMAMLNLDEPNVPSYKHKNAMKTWREA